MVSSPAAKPAMRATDAWRSVDTRESPVNVWPITIALFRHTCPKCRTLRPALSGKRPTSTCASRSTYALGHELIELIQERRFAAITVQDILDRAGVGRTTFYTHYRTKEDVLHSRYERVFRWLEALSERASSSAASRTRGTHRRRDTRTRCAHAGRRAGGDGALVAGPRWNDRSRAHGLDVSRRDATRTSLSQATRFGILAV